MFWWPTHPRHYFLFFSSPRMASTLACLWQTNWSNYAHERKALRVTDPVGDQRPTYRLQTPYRYGVPLTLLSVILYWLVSQSLFLARVASYDSIREEDKSEMKSTIGYSCIAIISVIIVALGILNGFPRYRSGMPLVGSCSAAISVACHASDSPVFAVSTHRNLNRSWNHSPLELSRNQAK